MEWIHLFSKCISPKPLRLVFVCLTKKSGDRRPCEHGDGGGATEIEDCVHSTHWFHSKLYKKLVVD